MGASLSVVNTGGQDAQAPCKRCPPSRVTYARGLTYACATYPTVPRMQSYTRQPSASISANPDATTGIMADDRSEPDPDSNPPTTQTLAAIAQQLIAELQKHVPSTSESGPSGSGPSGSGPSNVLPIGSGELVYVDKRTLCTSPLPLELLSTRSRV